MARGRCQTGAEAFAGPWEESEASRPIGREPFRVHQRDGPHVVHAQDGDNGARRPIRKRGALDLFTECLALALATDCHGEQRLVFEGHTGRRRRWPCRTAISRRTCYRGKPCDLWLATGSTRRRTSAGPASS
jgi:hypothetical protein